MRNYFSFRLKGLSIFVPCFVALVAVYAYCIVNAVMFQGESIFLADIAIDSNWVALFIVWFVSVYVLTSIMCGAVFFVVKRSVESLTYSENAFETDYRFGEYAKMVLPNILLVIVTAGIYLPWFANKLMKYFAARTTHNFNLMEFGGTPMTLFVYSVLLYALPLAVLSGIMDSIGPLEQSGDGMAIFWYILTMHGIFFFASMYTACIYPKWLLRFWYGNRRVASTATVWGGCWFIFGQMLLCLVTLCLYAPAACLKIYRYYIRKMVAGDEMVETRFGYDLRPWRDYFYLLGQGLLVLLTLGIYWPWGYARISERIINRIYVENEEKHSEPMPEWK